MDSFQIKSILEKCLPQILDSSYSVPCPKGCRPGFHEGNIASLIVHLNDDHKWSREQIADWLDTLDVDLSFPVPEGET